MSGAATAPAGSAAQEWRQHWPLVMASMVALSLTTIGVYSMGLFMEPLANEFGWSRAQISSGLTIFSVIAVPLGPFAGALVDRFGSRRIALPGVFLTGGVFSLFALLDGSLIMWWSIWLVYSLVAMGVKSFVWTAAVSSVFHSGRSLALAVVLCGSGIGSTGTPLLANWLIADYGWRVAYVVIGMGWSLVILLFLVPFFFDARDRQRRQPQGAALAVPPPQLGLATREAWRNPPLVKLAIALSLLSGLITALIVHYVPVLREHGISNTEAAAIISLLGIIAVPAKLTVGWLIDRLPVGLVAGTIFTLPLVTCLLLLTSDGSVPVIVAATLVLGLSSGGYFHLAAYMTSRFAGLLNFGKIYGFMTSVMSLAAGITPVVAGAVFDSTGSYSLVLTACIPVALFCGGLVATLGSFPDWSPRRDDETQAVFA